MRCCSVEGDRSRFCVSVSLSTVHYRTQTLQNRALGNLPTTVHCASAKKKKKKEAHENRRERECACGQQKKKKETAKKKEEAVCLHLRERSLRHIERLAAGQTNGRKNGEREEGQGKRKNRNTVFVRFVLFSALLLVLTASSDRQFA